MAVVKNWPSGMDSYTEPLAILAETLKPHKILEIGIGEYAFSTTVWLEHCSAQLTTVDKGDWGANTAGLKQEYGDRFTFISQRSEIALPKLKGKFDLIYIDGDHFYEGVRTDILNSQKLLAKGGVILVDDYGVEEGTADIVDGNLIGGPFGVKQACDECFKGWKEVYTNIPFGNGARAYAKR